MMPIAPRKEPVTFQDRVRKPGYAFLRKNPAPTQKQWKTHAYWTRCASDLYQAYGGICAYSCHFIPSDTGSRTVDHFKAKNIHPKDAYNWRNYRLVCGVLNGRKGTHDILDPFKLVPEIFCIRFPSLLVRPCENVQGQLRNKIEDTITVLGLNDEGTCFQRRQGFVRDYCLGLCRFDLLERDAPFLASEIRRQGLITTLPNVMGLR
jgi:hypothetical protein